MAAAFDPVCEALRCPGTAPSARLRVVVYAIHLCPEVADALWDMWFKADQAAELSALQQHAHDALDHPSRRARRRSKLAIFDFLEANWSDSIPKPPDVALLIDCGYCGISGRP